MVDLIYVTTAQIVDFHWQELPKLISNFVRDYERLSEAHLNLWFAEESNCWLQLTKLANSSVMSLGTLLFSILDEEEEKDSQDSWEGVLKHSTYQQQSNNRTPLLVSCV